MTHARFQSILANLPLSRIAVVGDFCLDRYLEIDPVRAETSIETGLEVYNVTHVRSQPGAAGTILNNLVDLSVSELYPVGFCGEDGEGYELLAALKSMPGVQLDYFLQTPERRTFTYCKPLVLASGQPPRELSRLDSKNWSPTPANVSQQIVASLEVESNKLKGENEDVTKEHLAEVYRISLFQAANATSTESATASPPTSQV